MSANIPPTAKSRPRALSDIQKNWSLVAANKLPPSLGIEPSEQPVYVQAKPVKRRSRSSSPPRAKPALTIFDPTKSLKRVDSPRKYIYRPLSHGQIRRLRLVITGNDDEELHGYLETVPLSSYSNYTAISYLWGNPLQTSRLLLENHEYIPLTASLNELLGDVRKFASKKHSRDKYFVIVLWVDQICINQEDDVEKAKQVAMMAEIYKNARAVYTYIGPEKPGFELAFDFMMKFCNLCAQHRQGNLTISPAEWQIILSSLGEIPKESDQIWHSIKELLSGEWILRSWIFQEAVLNDTTVILCGTLSYTANLLFEFSSLLCFQEHYPLGYLLEIYSNSFCIDPPINNLSLWMFVQQLYTIKVTRSILDDKQERFTMFHLLERTMCLRASVPRDKIYSLLGMATDANSLEIIPDYYRPDVEIFTEFARKLFLVENNLQILECVDDSSPSRGSWPSWVPNWSSNSQRNWVYTTEKNWAYTDRDGLRYPYSAGGNIPPVISFSTDGYSLISRGAVVDTISDVLGVPIRGYFLSDMSIFQRCEEYITVYVRTLQAISSNGIKFSVEDQQRFMFVTAMGNDINTHKTNKSTLWDAFRIWMEFVIFVNSADELLEDHTLDDQIAICYDLFKHTLRVASDYFTPAWVSSGRAVGITKEGRLCMCPPGVQPGDKIVVLVGGRMCYILRSIPGSQDHCKYIGYVYCEGLMEGEALADRSSDENVRNITIV